MRLITLQVGCKVVSSLIPHPSIMEMISSFGVSESCPQGTHKHFNTMQALLILLLCTQSVSGQMQMAAMVASVSNGDIPMKWYLGECMDKTPSPQS